MPKLRKISDVAEISAIYFTWMLLATLTSCFAEFREDEVCTDTLSGKMGSCTSLSNCQYALNLIEYGISPHFCNPGSEAHNFNALVCCVGPNVKRIASLEMCNKYNRMTIEDDSFGIFVVGGRKSLAKEFPHMAIVGYGEEDDIKWLCGGSLISEKFVITAAHCVETVSGSPEWVRLGDLDIANKTDDADPQDFRVVRTVVHPNYQPPSLYHDIGLLELDRQPKFTKYVSPACLYSSNDISEKTLSASGWGRTDFAGEVSSHLLAVDLSVVNVAKCNNFYNNVPKRRISQGIISKLQVCAGGNDGKDTCQGDSGGPLQRKNPSYSKNKKIYDIIGITSFGRGCGLGESPGIYTRVSAYLDWIENIVWPGFK